MLSRNSLTCFVWFVWKETDKILKNVYMYRELLLLQDLHGLFPESGSRLMSCWQFILIFLTSSLKTMHHPVISFHLLLIEPEVICLLTQEAKYLPTKHTSTICTSKWIPYPVHTQSMETVKTTRSRFHCQEERHTLDHSLFGEQLELWRPSHNLSGKRTDITWLMQHGS